MKSLERWMRDEATQLDMALQHQPAVILVGFNETLRDTADLLSGTELPGFFIHRMFEAALARHDLSIHVFEDHAFVIHGVDSQVAVASLVSEDGVLSDMGLNERAILAAENGVDLEQVVGHVLNRDLDSDWYKYVSGVSDELLGIMLERNGMDSFQGNKVEAVVALSALGFGSTNEIPLLDIDDDPSSYDPDSQYEQDVDDMLAEINHD